MTYRNGRVCGAAVPALLTCGLLAAGASHANVLVVDPFDEAAGVPRAGMAELDVAILGEERFDVRDILKRSLRIGVVAGPSSGGHARLLGVRWRDVDGDGDRDLVARIDLEDALDDLEEGLASELFAEFVLRTRGRGGPPRFRQMKLAAPLEDTATLADAASACKVVSTGAEPPPVRCVWTSGAGVTPLGVADLVGDLNDGLLAGSGTEIAADAEVAIEATGGSGGIQGYNDTPPCGATYIATGAPGPGGYAATVQTLSDLAELWIYPGGNGATPLSRFAGGSASVVALNDLTGVDPTGDPAAQGILVIGGGGGSGGDWDECGCNDGHDGGAGGIAQLSANADASAAGGSAGQSAVDGGGGNVDGAGGAGSGAGDDADLAGQAGIGGFGGPQGDAVARWNGATIDWTAGQGGPSTSAAGSGQCQGVTAVRGAGGGGYGGGGGGGGAPGQHIGSGGGGGSWARRAVASNPGLLQGKASSAMVVVTFATTASD